MIKIPRHERIQSQRCESSLCHLPAKSTSMYMSRVPDWSGWEIRPLILYRDIVKLRWGQIKLHLLVFLNSASSGHVSSNALVCSRMAYCRYVCFAYFFLLMIQLHPAVIDSASSLSIGWNSSKNQDSIEPL